MWKKIIERLPLSFPPAVGGIHWMRIYEPPPNKKRRFGDAHEPRYTCNIGRSEYRFYDYEVRSVTDEELLSLYGTTHNLMPQSKDSFASAQHFKDPNSAMQVVYQHALAEGKTITEALTLALGLDDGADPNFDRLFYFIPKEADPNV